MLTSEDLWEVISEDQPAAGAEGEDATIINTWKKKDAKAKAKMGLLVDNDQLIHVKNSKSAKELWNLLKDYHQKATAHGKMFYIKSLFNKQLPENGDMEKHINSMIEELDKLAAIGKTLDDDIFISAIFNSLPPSYSILITTMESHPEDLTVSFVKGKLLEEYRKRKLKDSENSSSENALKVTFKNDSKSKSSCFFCKKFGHMKKNCRSYKAWLEKQQKQNSGSNVKPENSANICFLTKEEAKKSDDWLIDSGATSHMTYNKSFFSKFSPSNMKVQVAKKDIIMDVLGTGSGIIKFLDKNGTQVKIELENVLYIPVLEHNLISVSKLTNAGCKILFNKRECQIQLEEKATILGTRCGDLYKIIKNEVANLTVNTEGKHNKNCQHVWHRKFGHRDPESIIGLESKLLATGIKVQDCTIREQCEFCLQGKMARKPFTKESSSKSNAILDLIHTDVCGPIETVTPGNNRFILTIIDDFSRYCTIRLMKHKSEVTGLIKEFVKYAKTQFGKTPKMIRSDQGREYVNNDLRNYLRSEGIKIQYTVKYTPEQNGVAERKNRTLVEMSRCMLIDAGLPKKY